MEKLKKNNQGITLIALVITIIVLLILAGVSIAMLTGNNGILKKADDAKRETTIKGAKEAVELEVAGSFDDNGKYSATIAKANMEKNLNGVTVTESNGTLSVNYDGYDFNVDKNGNIGTIGDATKYLKLGDYVNYPDKDGNNILCKVLYNDSNYGLQLVAVNSVCKVTIGDKDPTIPSNMASSSQLEKSRYSYNNMIKTLNDKADIYRNSNYTNEGDARCIGSVPNNPNSEVDGYFNSEFSYMLNYNGTFKNASDYYYDNEDLKQLKTINAKETDNNIASTYWIACRHMFSNSDYTIFNGVNVSSDGITGNSTLCVIDSAGNIRLW